MLSALSFCIALIYPTSYSVDFQTPALRIDTSCFFGTAHWPDTPELKAQAIPRLKKYGIRLIRNDVKFESVFPPEKFRIPYDYTRQVDQPGFYDRLNWDSTRWMKEAKDEGFRTIAIFTYFPQFLTVNGSLPAKDDQRAWEIWSDICGKTAQRLDRYVDYYEVFNETHFFTKPDRTGFKRSVEADPYIFYYGEKGIRPFTKKPIGGTATWIDCWAGSGLETLPYDSRITNRSLNFASIHVYDTQTLNFLARLNHAREILDGNSPQTPPTYDKRLKGKQLWVSEWDFYWGDKQVPQEWYGYVLTELIKRGINNCIYNYKETFLDASVELQKPWLLLVRCGLNEKAQKVTVHPISSFSPDETFNTTAVTLPDGSAVLLAANLSAEAKPVTWRLSGWTGTGVGKLFISKGPSEEPEVQPFMNQSSTGEVKLDVPGKSFVALRLEPGKRRR